MIHVLIGYYGDGSAVFLLGAYHNGEQARDRLAIAHAVQPSMNVKCFPMRDDQADIVDVLHAAGSAND